MMQNFTPATLLTVIVGLISVLGTILTWDGERMISAVDDLKTNYASDHQSIQNDEGAIVRLGNNQQILFNRSNEHEIRITKIEDVQTALVTRPRRK